MLPPKLAPQVKRETSVPKTGFAVREADTSIDRGTHLLPTPGLTLGPFYPVAQSLDAGSSARLANSLAGRPLPRTLSLRGRVCDTLGRALTAARVEIWHADAAGHYQHPGEPNLAQVSPDFIGYGTSTTGKEGRWHFTTIMPGPYRHGGTERAPHVHFQVTHRGHRLVTQMFFPNQSMNLRDRWYRTASRPKLLIARPAVDPRGCLALDFDLVMPCAEAEIDSVQISKERNHE